MGIAVPKPGMDCVVKEGAKEAQRQINPRPTEAL